MRHGGGKRGLVALTVLHCAIACGGNETPTSPSVPPPTPTPTPLVVVVSAPHGMFVGEQSQAQALSNSQIDVSALATWRSSNTSVATITASGSVVAVAPGTTALTATYQGVSGSDTATVLRDSDLLGLVMIAPSTQLQIGQTVNYAVVLDTPGPGSGVNVSDKATWSSTNPGAVSVAPGGHATAVGPGQATLIAIYRGKTASVVAVVNSAQPQPQQDTLRIDGGAQTGQFRVGNSVSLSLGGSCSVVSAASGQLSLTVFDQNSSVITTTAPMTVPRGINPFSLTATFVIPQNATRVCATTIFQVGSKTILATDLAANVLCVAVSP